ncbi:MAG TPA: amidohydrolase family protein [Actinomycetota bacterium]|nr:amidohydrolase family protein [Actinomycetota bacterium]
MTFKTLLRGGCVLTLGARTPNLKQGDVLIDEGLIAEVGPSIRARDAEQVDATDTVVMPGFVDTHRHTWTSLFRNIGERGSRPSSDTAAGRLGPDDVYAATLIGLLGAAEAGITTVVDWSDLPSDDELVRAALRAHADSGLRTAFVHAAANGGGGHTPLDPAGPTTSIAFGSTLPPDPDLDRVAAEWARARASGLRIHAHPGPGGSGRGTPTRLGERGLMGEDVTLLHRTELDDADVESIGSSGAGVTLSPSSDMAGGLGPPPIQQLIDHGVRPGLGVDDERVAPGDMFAQMRATISLQHATVFERKLAGKAALPKLMSTRDVIRLATVDGARVAGLRGVTGSIEPGMQADVVVLRADRPNIFPVNDPIGAVVWGMDTSNVDWVFVGGRVVMRGGVLEADVERVRDLAEEARRRVGDASGVVASASTGGTE